MEQICEFNVNGTAVKSNKDLAAISEMTEMDRVKNIIEKDIKFDVDSSKISIEKGSNPDESDYVKFLMIPNSIGVNRFMNNYGKTTNWNDPIVTGLDINDYKKLRLPVLEELGLDPNESFNKEVDSWSHLTNYGEIVHGILEDVINGVEIRKINDLSEEIVSNIVVQAKDLIKSIKSRHGEGAKLYSELWIKSKELNSNITPLLKDMNSLNGKIDLLVLDVYGNAHIYDFKVSRKEVGAWNEMDNDVIKNGGYWHSTKKLQITNQLAFYNAILKQYGIKVKSTNIIPVKLGLDYKDEHKLEIADVNNITIGKSIDIVGATSGSILTNATTILPSNFTGEVKDLLNTLRKYQVIFPNVDVSKEIKRKDATYDYYRNLDGFVRKYNSDSKHRELYEFYFYKRGVDNKKLVQAINEDDLKLKLTEYIEELNSKKADELDVLSDNIEKAIIGDISKSEISAFLPENRRHFVDYQFNKYIVDGWTFLKNRELNSAGFFIFQKDNRSEIVMISNMPLLNVNNLGKGRSLLGEFIDDSKWDKQKILAASNGNLDLMKAMTYVSENQDVFKDAKVSEIRTINPWLSQEVTALSSQLIDNWKQLMLYKSKSVAEIDMNPNITESLFNLDVNSLIDIANDFLKLTEVEVDNFIIKSNAIQTEYTKEWLTNKLYLMKIKYPKLNGEYNAYDPTWKAYTYLLKALMKLNGVVTYYELDSGNYLNGGLNIVGLNLSSIQYSPSVNAQILGNIMNNYSSNVRSFVDRHSKKMVDSLNDFYDESGRIKAIGGEAKYFLSWFETDSNGKMNPELILKNPDNSEFNGSPKSKKALTMFLNIMNLLKYDNDLEKIEDAKISGDYYKIPLLEAKFARQSKNQGLFKSLKDKFLEHSNVVEGVLAGNISEKQEYEKTTQKLYNRFNITSQQRSALIDQYGSGFFETDLERVFNEVLVSYAKENVSKDMMPIIQGIKLSLQYQQDYGGNDLKNTIEFVNKFVEKKIHSNPIIEKQLLPAYKFLSVLKSGFSKLSLGLNSKSFGREMLQGWYVGFSRAGVQMMDGITMETYVQGYTEVLQNAYKNVSSISKLQQLNSQYGMASYSLNEVADQKRSNWLGVSNWSENTLFLTASAPDFQHRMAILVAKMMGDGCWDAHTIDSDGNLQYDFNKDSRYEQFIQGNTSHKDYLYQKTLYLKNKEQFVKDGYYFEESDLIQPLPRAYTSIEAAKIKNHSELLYGHYDAETRALVNDMFIGSFFMQYKTFMIAKLEQWFLKPGVYNGRNLKQQFDPDTGEPLWEVSVYPNEDGSGFPYQKIVKESEVTAEEREQGLAQPYITWQGEPIEGIAYSLASYAKAIYKMDQEELNLLWQDPIKRKNLALALHDMILMSLLAMVIKALFDIENLREEHASTQWVYGVLLGSTQDGPVHQILSSLFSDLNPPMLSSIQKISNSTMAVIHDDASLGLALTQNVGALREFQGAFK